MTKLEQALKRIDMRYYIPISPQQFIDAAYYNTLLADARLVAEQYEKATGNMKTCFDICLYEDLFDKWWLDRQGNKRQLVGILSAMKDFYWVMAKDGNWEQAEFLSCVGSIEMFDYTPLSNGEKVQK